MMPCCPKHQRLFCPRISCRIVTWRFMRRLQRIMREHENHQDAPDENCEQCRELTVWGPDE